MNGIFLEHVNITVSDPVKSAETLCALFDWHIRWQGKSKDDGYTVHVGDEHCYLALYRSPESVKSATNSYVSFGGLNHVALVVDDLDKTEQRVLAAGYKTHNHGNYEPGRRFYFNDADDIEFEIVNYS